MTGGKSLQIRGLSRTEALAKLFRAKKKGKLKEFHKLKQQRVVFPPWNDSFKITFTIQGLVTGRMAPLSWAQRPLLAWCWTREVRQVCSR